MAVILTGTSFVIFLLDILIKQSIEEQIQGTEERNILGGKVILRKVYNKGAMLNLLEKFPGAVKCISLFLGIVMLVYSGLLSFRKGRRLQKTGMAFLIGGAFSNIYDRIVRGKVVDYLAIRTKWKKITNITFNIGDLFIFAGSLLGCLGRTGRR